MFLKLVSVSGGIKEYGKNVESSHTLIKKKMKLDFREYLK